MSIFHRICPHDSHTCTEKACLAGYQDVCALANTKCEVVVEKKKPDAFDVALDKMIGRAFGFYDHYGNWSL